MAGNPRIDELRKKLDKEPGSRLFAQLAEELRKDGDLEDAIQVAREGLQKHSNYPSARMTLGRALFDTGDWAAARAEFELVLKGAPDNILASRLLAESLEGLSDVPAAVARYKKTLVLAPGDKQVLERLEALEGTGAASSAAGGARAATQDVAPAESPAPIRVLEVDTPMELEETHERASPPGPQAAAPAAVEAPAPPAPTASSPAPIPVSSADEEFELERPYEPPRPAASVPAVPLESRPAEVVSPPHRPAAESMMEFEFEAGPAGSTIPFAPPPAPAPPSEGAPPALAPSDAPPPPVAVAAEPPPPAPATAPPPPAVFAPEPMRGPAPEPPAPPARTVEVPWSAPPPPRMAPPPAPPAPVPEPVRAEESASGELTSPTLAELYFKQGFPDKAVEVYRELVEREPDNERLRRRLAELQTDRSAAASAVAAALPASPAGATPAARDSDRASRRVALERTIARLEGLLAAIKKG